MWGDMGEIWGDMGRCREVRLLVAELLHLGAGLRVELLECLRARLRGCARVCEGA